MNINVKPTNGGRENIDSKNKEQKKEINVNESDKQLNTLQQSTAKADEKQIQPNVSSAKQIEQRNLNFIKADDGSVYIEVTDGETEEVIRRIPGDAVDEVVKYLKEFSGKIINTKI